MRPVNNIAGGSVQRSRLLERLLNSRPNLNNGTVAGGLAYGVDQLTRGLNANRAIQAEQQQLQQETDAMNAMARGMSAQQWTPPDAQIAMGPSGTPKGDVMIPREAAMQNAAPVGGYEGAIYATGQLGTPAGGRLTNQLLMGKMERELAQKERDSELMEVYDPTTKSMVFKPRGEVGAGAMSRAPAPTFEPVQNPFGRGGTGQRNSVTGEIINYQAPLRQESPKPVGDPIEVMGPDGRPALIQRYSDNSTRPVNLGDGYSMAPSSAFQGTGMEAQVYSILTNGDPASPQYAAAYAYASQPKTTFQNGQVFTITPDVSWARPPSGVQQTPVQTAAASGGPASTAPMQMGQPTPVNIAPGVTATTIQTPEMNDQRRKDLDQTNAMLNTVNQVINHPSREKATGVESLFPTFPGSKVAGFEALQEQLQGQAFLQAYQSLRGGGQITEVEGLKAEQATARLRSAQRDEDYLDAVKELRSVLERAKARMMGVPESDLPPLYQPAYMRGTASEPLDAGMFSSGADVDSAPAGTVVRGPSGLWQKQPDGSWDPVQGRGQDPAASVRGMGPSSRP